MQQRKSIRLGSVVFVGRTLGEYQKFFDLDLAEMVGMEVLDCHSSASSFVAEANSKGVHAVGCDPEYSSGYDVLKIKGLHDIRYTVDSIYECAELYDWGYYHYLELLEEYMMLSLRRFLEDFSQSHEKGEENRYVAAGLPDLPFNDEEFDMVLSSFYLFSYSDRLDYSFHLTSLLELFRVARREVRIYPVVGPDARPYPHLNRLISNLRSKGVGCAKVPVPFEFQKGSGFMLRLTR